MNRKYKYPCIDVDTSNIGSMVGMIDAASPSQEARQTILRTLRASFQVNELWKPGDTIRIAFMDGDSVKHQWVRSVIETKLVPFIKKLTLQWNSPLAQSDVRISFAQPFEAWSIVGIECRNVSKDVPTMNLGWLDDDRNYNSSDHKGTGQVVVHEFCHMLGMIHEHQNPKSNPIVWNKPVVSAELRKQGWSDDDIRINMFEKYGDAELCKKDPNFCGEKLVNGSRYDKLSIMHYFYPSHWILKGPVDIPVNVHLSVLDKKWIRKYYS